MRKKKKRTTNKFLLVTVGDRARKIIVVKIGKETGKERSPVYKDPGVQERLHRREISRKRFFPSARQPLNEV